MTTAWHGAAFGRSKKMPALSEVLGDKPEKHQQTPEEMLAVMQSLVARST